MARLAVVMFNLGGPDRLEAVQPFLFNLFNDPAIINLPRPLRWLLARAVARRRAPIARQIYAHLGGRSPLLELTRAQARGLEKRLIADGDEARVFISMRYWHPMSLHTAREVRDFDPDEIVLLPLYPQFSTTTSGSSLDDWRRAAKRVGLKSPTCAVCCYPMQSGWVRAVADLTAQTVEIATKEGEPRVLFSAHGLPRKVIDAGDPYQWQVEQTSAAVVEEMGIPDLDWVVCYQSRVGPLEWIGPSTEQELARAAADQVPVVVVPIAFVSEHSETLVELDLEYREEADRLGIPAYYRVHAVGTHPDFIEGLHDLVRSVRRNIVQRGTADGTRFCATQWARCACQGER